MKRNPAFWWPCSAAWAALIFLLSSRPGFQVEPPFPHFDKLVHMFLYGMLCLLLFISLGSSLPKLRGRHLLALAVLASFTYGITDEIHQAFVPGRSCDSIDAFANLIGAILVALGLGFSRKMR